MVNLTAAYVEKKCSQTQSNKSLTKEIHKDHVRKITHLFMNNKFISTIKCLEVLNVTGNRISSLEEIRHLKKLEILEAKNNLMKSIEDVTESVRSLPFLRQLSLEGNPVTKTYRYRENLIANHDYLANLDGKQITENCRNFMKKFKLEKLLQQTRKKPELSLSEDITNSLNLPPAFKRSISRAVFQHVGPKFPISVTSANGEIQSQFPPWKTTESVKGSKGNHTMPRPFWRSISKVKKQINIPRPRQGSVTFPKILNQDQSNIKQRNLERMD
ncbi:protein phosphatase 1 regulatory subunit 42-like isoform X2 [Belonocnema kinseyi]|uniref:protein phosphatase 1 regulatory subunit 42-like isoform X2 n=1 Tax=Belonocnema kinseyi TaxID=2817044 RepID=UPI00143CC1D9|nr:protein phosphatase 1 regulatory subunit 42-like isoform X2 [Belonocnema kinseyi]